MKRLSPLLIIIALLFLFLGLGFSLPTTLAVRQQASGTGRLPAIIFVEAPAAVPGPLAGRFPQGSHLVRYTPGTPAASAVNLTPKFFAVADPQISFGAKRVLFAGQITRRANWQIWEMKVDGSGLKQVTHCPGNCFQPVYLPHNQIAYTVVEGRGSSLNSSIDVSQLNGADPHPITFGPGNYQLDTVLHSGRLLVSAKSSLVPGSTDNRSRVFYTLRPDGSGLKLFRWDNRPDYVWTDATELRDGSVLFVKRHDPAGRVTGSALALIHQGALHNSALTPSTSEYWSAHVLDGNTLVVARKDMGASDRTDKFNLYAFNLAGKSVDKKIYSSPKFSSIEAVPVEPRVIPLYYPSILHLSRDYGRIICLNSYRFSGTPNGRLTRHIAKVRVIALGPHHSVRILGEAPVESDGSFYIKVPADQPVRFELLGTNDSVIRSQKSWIWARKGEDVACLGCHANHAFVPRDHFPLALKSFNTPIPIGLPARTQTKQH